MNMAVIVYDYKAIPDLEEKRPTQDWISDRALWRPLRRAAAWGDAADRV
jgi:hypothetical protein